MNIRFTLVAEGPTDAVLLPILKWAIRCDRRVVEIEEQFADPFRMPPARRGLAEKVRKALELYPANLLFIHRDADRESLETRTAEVEEAVRSVNQEQPAVPVIPVRMTEAWLLIEETAIRSAAGNPRGSQPLGLPARLATLERMADPKAELKRALREACGLRGRRLARFNLAHAVSLVSERISDFSILRQFGAFAEFERRLSLALDACNR